MIGEVGWRCSSCGARHEDAPLSYAAAAPDVWSDEAFGGREDSFLDEELCVIRAEHFFIRGLIEIPVLDTGEVFSWNVWASLSAASFQRVLEAWERPDRQSQPPCFGWLSTSLGVYGQATLNLKTNAHTRAPGRRPFIELEPTGHPLAVEQREGITSARVREIAESVLHGRPRAADPRGEAGER